jgi:hypothetical protein
MTNFRKPLKVGILGATGIGRVHARIYHELGAKVVAVLCSTDQSATMAAAELSDSLGIDVKPFFRVEDMLSEPLDAVSICTPPALHLQHMAAAFIRKIPVFCEKPLFWNKYLTIEIVERELEILRDNALRRLFVNTSNTVFVDCVCDRLPNPMDVRRFSFMFYTKGPFQRTDIAQDLLPHGLSMLIRIFGERHIRSFDWDVGKDRFRCSFLYGACAVEFDFQENPEGARELGFSLDNLSFRRVQEGRGASYAVYLIDENTDERIHCLDPFKVYLARFLDYCVQNAESVNDDFHDASINLRLMAKCLGTINEHKGVSFRQSK